MKRRNTILFLTILGLLSGCLNSNNIKQPSSGSSQESIDRTDETADINIEPTSSSEKEEETGSNTDLRTTIEETADRSRYEEGNYRFEYIEDYSSLYSEESMAPLRNDVSLEGVSFSGGEITQPGRYYLSGAIEAITLNLSEPGEVHLVLNNATIDDVSKAISSSKTDQTTKLFLTLVENSSNSFNTTKNTIECAADVIINGLGTLIITSANKSGIKTNQRIYIFDSTLVIYAQGYEDGHGISAQSILAFSSNIAVKDCGKDGLHAEISDAGLTKYVNSEGFIYLQSVSFSYFGEGDGMQADSFLYADSSTIDIESKGHFVAYQSEEATTYGITNSDDFKFKKTTDYYKKIDSEQRGKSGTYALANSVKGIKVGEIDQEDNSGSVTEISSQFYKAVLSNSNLTINTDDDAVHVNYGSLVIDHSRIEGSSLDQVLASDGPLTIDQSRISIFSSYEGIQGSSIHINGRNTTLTIHANDDGMNASTNYANLDEEYYRRQLIINGGELNVIAGGDGLDSNGSILVNGGKVYVEGSSQNNNSPIDSADSRENSKDHGVIINGGEIFAIGSSGMIENPSNSSEQNSLVYSSSTTLSKGKKVSITDESGNELFAYVTSKDLKAIIASSPSFVIGNKVKIYLDGSLLSEITLTSKVTTFGNSSRPGPR